MSNENKLRQKETVDKKENEEKCGKLGKHKGGKRHCRDMMKGLRDGEREKEIPEIGGVGRAVKGKMPEISYRDHVGKINVLMCRWGSPRPPRVN